MKSGGANAYLQYKQSRLLIDPDEEVTSDMQLLSGGAAVFILWFLLLSSFLSGCGAVSEHAAGCCMLDADVNQSRTNCFSLFSCRDVFSFIHSPDKYLLKTHFLSQMSDFFLILFHSYFSLSLFSAHLSLLENRTTVSTSPCLGPSH